jgi:hypothetical protein
VITSATVDASSVTPGIGSAAFSPDGSALVWTVGDLAPATTRTLTYRVTVNPGAQNASIRNVVTGAGDSGPAECAPPGSGLRGTSARALVTAEAPDPNCSTTHSTPLAATVVKQVLGTPTTDAGTGDTTVEYRVIVTNPNSGVAVP